VRRATVPTTSSASTAPAGSAPLTSSSTAGAATIPAGSSNVIATANAICARRNRELVAVTDVRTALPAIAATARKRAAIERLALTELERLMPPASIAAHYRKMVIDYRDALLRVVKMGERAEAGDVAGTQRAKTRAGAQTLRLLVATAHTGLKDCAGIAEGPGAPSSLLGANGR
jgi:hypothetical protein